MSTFLQILAILAAAIILWILFRGIKGNPDAFSKENMNKSFYSMAILGLILIGFVAFLVFLLRAS